MEIACGGDAPNRRSLCALARSRLLDSVGEQQRLAQHGVRLTTRSRFDYIRPGSEPGVRVFDLASQCRCPRDVPLRATTRTNAIRHWFARSMR